MISEIFITPPVAMYLSPTSMTDLRPINFIFGANGTGKTTISRIIAQDSTHTHCLLRWKNAAKLQTMVYNRDFVERNFNQENTVKGVFTLGDNQVEAEQQIANLKPEIDKLTEQINGLHNQLNGNNGVKGKISEMESLELKMKNKCWEQKKAHDDYFLTAFTGVRNSADNFKAKILSEYESNTSELLTLEQLKEKANVVFSKNPKTFSYLTNISINELLAIESNELLGKVIIGNQDVDIATLINKIGNSDWVRQGLEYHKHSLEKCPFCQQPTNEELSKKLMNFFNETYAEETKSINGLLNKYVGLIEFLQNLIDDNIQKENQFLKVELFQSESKALFERLKVNEKLLQDKVNQPSKIIKLEQIKPSLDILQNLIDEANVETKKHNEIVSGIDNEKVILISQIWKYIVNEIHSDLFDYNKNKSILLKQITGMNAGIEDKSKRKLAIEGEIGNLEKQSTSIRPTMNTINLLLKKFGFNSFHIEVEGDTNHYKISKRNGDNAGQSLSEGEKTFITFLYFYSLIKGAQSSIGISDDRVIVFDDPISSLDSDILYIVSSLIKEILEEVRGERGQIKQVFILTHNVYFHKEICFHKKRSKRNAMAHESFWIVKKQEGGSVINRCEENPIRSAYELLWEDINSSNVSSLNIQNTLRRILENYFTIWGGKSKDEICDLFDGNDKLICNSLFSWVNDGSHAIHEDLYINHGSQTNESYLKVFREIFVKSDQIGHYNMMTGNI
ncbi:AAA family ATPase [Morganella morganii]|nr:AAA family ATPase [Morganella morganii]